MLCGLLAWERSGLTPLQFLRHLPCSPKEGECALRCRENPWLSRALPHLSAFPSPLFFSQVTQTHPPCSQGPALDPGSMGQQVQGREFEERRKPSFWVSCGPCWHWHHCCPAGFGHLQHPLQGQPAPAPSSPGCISHFDGVIFFFPWSEFAVFLKWSEM